MQHYQIGNQRLAMKTVMPPASTKKVLQEKSRKHLILRLH
jgi:hypothetical protein